MYLYLTNFLITKKHFLNTPLVKPWRSVLTDISGWGPSEFFIKSLKK